MFFGENYAKFRLLLGERSCFAFQNGFISSNEIECPKWMDFTYKLDTNICGCHTRINNDQNLKKTTTKDEIKAENIGFDHGWYISMKIYDTQSCICVITLSNFPFTRCEKRNNFNTVLFYMNECIEVNGILFIVTCHANSIDRKWSETKQANSSSKHMSIISLNVNVYFYYVLLE